MLFRKKLKTVVWIHGINFILKELFYAFEKATSKTWTQTLDPDPEKPGS